MFTNSKLSVIIISILLGMFVAAAWFGYNHLSTEKTEPLQAFPNYTSFVLEIQEPLDFLENLNNGNAFWLDLISNKKFSELNNFLILLQKQSNLDENLEALLNQSIYLSFLENDQKESGILMILKSNEYNLASIHTRLFNKLKGVQYSAPTNDTSYAYIQTDSSHFYLAHKKGLFFISSNENIIREAQNKLPEEKDFIQSPDFNQLKATRGKRADAYVYLKYSTSDQLLKNLLSAEGISKLKPSKFANYSVLDVILKKEEILLNGYTTAYDSLKHYLAGIQNQSGQKSQLAISMPFTTESFIAFNLSNYRHFIEKQNNGNYLKSKQDGINKMIGENALDITEQWWAGEMALIIDEKQQEYAVFTAKSGREAFRLLADIAHQSQPKIITETYREQKIKEINTPDFLISQFGPLFSNFKEVYYCVIDEAVIFAKTLPQLKSYIDALILGNNLSKNESYIEFSDNLSEDAIVSIYSRAPQSKHPLFHLFLSEGKKLFANYENLIENIKGIGIQISNKNDLFYTGVFINHGTNLQEKPTAWQIELEAPISAGPFSVSNHLSGENSILVQDEYNTLYFIDSKGDIIWTQMLREKIKSQVFTVDSFKNGKGQYLFNTLNFIYLIDVEGNPLSNYPLQLHSEASNGLSVFDYSSKKEYRILIAGKNGELYNYELNGQLLKGWKAENTRKEIKKPLTHLVANNKDYIISEAGNGNIIMYNRRGRIRLEIRKSFTNALGSDIYANHTNQSKGMVVTTDTEGNFVYIPEKGAVNKTSFGKMSDKHFFHYADFDGNTEMDFIYLDGTKLRIFDKFKKTILAYDFFNSIMTKPQLFTYNSKMILGVVDENENQLYLFNKNGLLTDKVLKGNTPFISGKLNDSKTPSILIGLGKSLYNYPLD